MMRETLLRGSLLVLLAAGGCFDVASLGTGGGDAALASLDQAVPDEAIVDQAVPDEAVVDQAVPVDEAASPPDGTRQIDFPVIVVRDQGGIDLAAADLASCGLVSQPCCQGSCTSGCCDLSQSRCVAVGTGCGTGLVCRGPNSCVSCGLAQQPCCAGNSCLAGGCCAQTMNGTTCIPSGASPPNLPGNVCSDGQAGQCGLPNEPCCSAGTCHSGGCCDGIRCIGNTSTCADGVHGCASGSCSTCLSMACPPPCGGAGQACCPGSRLGGNAADYCTAPGMACSTGPAGFPSCNGCGGGGQPCCDGNRCGPGACCDHGSGGGVCIVPGAGCSPGLGSCDDGGCMGGGCGKRGQQACGGNVGCTGGLTVNANGLCVACGGRAQPCCDGQGGGGYCSPPYACGTNRTCQVCGGNGQPCCPGSQCYTSSNGRCDGNTGTCL